MESPGIDPRPDALEEDVDLDQEQENFTVIDASEDLAAELTEVAEGSTVIEVPVSYTELQSTQATEFIVEDNVDNGSNKDNDDTSDEEDADDPDFDPDDDDDEDFDPDSDGKPKKKMKIEHSIEVEKCSICGATVADLAIHIVNIHSGNRPSMKKENTVTVREKRDTSPVALLAQRPRKRAYCKGKYQQIKPVLRYPCDACKHVSKTSEQLKKHMIVSHKGNKATAWMFCGECEYATKVEEELVNHVKMHQVFRLLKDDMEEREEEEDEEEEEEVPIKSSTGLGNYDPNPMNCGDCDFETHYENELFEHLKMHLRKDANIPEDTANEVQKKKGIIDAQVEQRTIYEEDDCLHCGLCTFSSKSKKNMLRHSNIVHGVVINDKDYQGGTTITVKQTAYHCTLCKFKGTTREELAQHRKRTIHNKYGGVTAVDPIAEAEERKARIRNNCL